MLSSAILLKFVPPYAPRFDKFLTSTHSTLSGDGISAPVPPMNSLVPAIAPAAIASLLLCWCRCEALVRNDNRQHQPRLVLDRASHRGRAVNVDSEPAVEQIGAAPIEQRERTSDARGRDLARVLTVENVHLHQPVVLDGGIKTDAQCEAVVRQYRRAQPQRAACRRRLREINVGQCERNCGRRAKSD